MARQIQPNPHGFNRWDTREGVQLAYQPDTILDSLYSRTTYIPATAAGIADHILIARGDVYNRGGDEVEDLTTCLVIANAFAAGLPLLEVAEANLRVAANLVMLLRKEVFKRDFLALTDDIWAEWMRPAGDGHEAGRLSTIPWLPAERAGLRVATAPETGIPLEQYQAIMTALKTVATPRVTHVGMSYVYTAAFLAMAKKGDITARKLEAVMNQIQAECGKQLDMQPSLLRMIWNKVGVHIPYASLGPMFERWEGITDGITLRMRVTLQQAAWTGLTQFTTIRRMMTEYPGFPWAKVATVLPADFANFTQAARIIGGDKYFGFKPNVGAAAATGFLSLGYVAKEMMVKVGGKEGSAILAYKGWIENPRSKTVLDTLIREWNPDGVTGQIEDDVEALAGAQEAVREGLEAAAAADVEAGVRDFGRADV